MVPKVLKKPGSRARGLGQRITSTGHSKVRIFGKGKSFDYTGRLHRGESLEIAEIPLTFWKPGGEYCILGDYWGKQTLVFGEVERVSIERSGSFVQLIVRGSDNPELVKWCGSEAEGGLTPEIYVHLCPAGCPRTSIGPNSLHGQRIVPSDPAAPWLGNVRAFQVKAGTGGMRLDDELAAIAGDRGVGGLGVQAAPEGPAEKKKKKNLTGDQTFEGSPLDPQLTLRQALKGSHKKKEKRRKKKKQRTSSRDSSDSNISTGDESSGGSEDPGHPFKDSHRIRRISRRSPGALVRHALEEVSRLLVESLGEEHTKKIRPLFLKYTRLHIMNKQLTPAQKREVLTLVYCLDKLVQRDILGCLDILVQRLKAIELVLGGASWQVAQNMELVPLEQERISSLSEAQEATKSFRTDFKVSRDLGKGNKGWYQKGDGKGKMTGKGKEGGKGAKGGAKDTGGAARVDPVRPH